MRRLIKGYDTLENLWFDNVPEKLRFLLVGGFNTVAAYLLFVLLFFLFNHHYFWSAIVQNALSINLSIITMRYYVFRRFGNFWREYLRAGSVYLCLIVLNLAWLYVFVDIMHLHALLAQLCYVAVSVVTTYFLHKYFSFCSKNENLS